MIVGLVSGIEPTDDLGRDHRRTALSWLAGTDDIRVRLEAELARICDRAEHHMPGQVDRHGQRRLIVRPEVPGP